MVTGALISRKMMDANREYAGSPDTCSLLMNPYVLEDPSCLAPMNHD
jgi:hypothetical protein